MKKKFLNVALLSVIACGAPATFTSCDDDGWKDRTNVLDEEMAENSKLIEQLTSQTKALETQIAQYKQEGDAAAKAADAAKAAADAAQKSGDDAMAAAKAADAAAQLAAKAAADAKAEAADALKKQYDELIALIKANAKEIESNSGKINDNANAIAKILETIDGSSKTFKDLQGTVAGLQVAIEALNGKAESLGLDVANLKKAMDEELGKLEANLLAEIKKNNETDAALQSEINAIKAELEKLGIATNLAEFTKFIGDANTQFDALKKYDEELTTKLADLASKVSAADALIKANQDSIASQKKALDEVNALAAKNATAILENTNKIAANAKDIEALKGEVTNVKNDIDTINKQVADIKVTLDGVLQSIAQINGELVTAVMEQLRGLVFVPKTFVDGIGSAVAYNIEYNAYKTVDAVDEDKKVNLITIPAAEYNKLKGEKDGNEAKKDFYPALATYYLNPSRADLEYSDLDIISNKATVISRSAETGLKLGEASYYTKSDGQITVAVSGDISKYSKTEIPVFALRANVYYEKTDAETGEKTIVKNVVTSDYARFYTSEVKLTDGKIKYGTNELGDISSIPNEPFARVRVNGSADLISELTVGDYKIAELENLGFAMDLSLVNYLKDGEKTSASSYATISDGKISIKNDRSAYGKQPLVCATLTYKGKIVAQGLFYVGIEQDKEWYEVKDVVAFSNMTFIDDLGEDLKLKNENADWFEIICNETGLSAADFYNKYKFIDAIQYYYDNKRELFLSDNNHTYGCITCTQSSNPFEPVINFGWKFDAVKDQQKVYESANHSVTTYVCFVSKDDNSKQYPPIYVPMTVGVDAKTVLSVSGKNTSMWRGTDYNSVLLNSEPATEFVGISASLSSYWTQGYPIFLGGKFDEKTPFGKDNYKYYFSAENNGKSFNVDGGKIVLSVENLYNECLIGCRSDKKGNGFSNANMGDHALLVGETGEYANKLIKAAFYEDGVKYDDKAPTQVVIATLNDGKIEIAQNTDAYELINKFGSIGNNELDIVVAMVPYDRSTGQNIAYQLKDNEFTVVAVRPMTASANGKSGSFKTPAANELSTVNLYELLSFVNWQNTDFASKADLFKYYGIKVSVDLDGMTTTMPETNAVNSEKYTAANSALRAAFEATVYEFDNATFGKDGKTEWDKATNEERIAGIKNAFAKISYKGLDTMPGQAFKVKVPVTVSYAMGDFMIDVVCVVEP